VWAFWSGPDSAVKFDRSVLRLPDNVGGHGTTRGPRGQEREPQAAPPPAWVTVESWEPVLPSHSIG
jgi:hypothetical protein